MSGRQKCLIAVLLIFWTSPYLNIEAAPDKMRGPASLTKKSSVSTTHLAQRDDRASSDRYFDNAYSSLQFLMVLYRTLVSDILGTTCPMSPTCGKYAFQALQATNDFKGFVFTVDRLIREHDIDKVAAPTFIQGRYCFYDPLPDSLH
ncbi:membrane protein insertion efficiency factor YidD [candidate division CSSED10-310 bacterium]|uniref:Membrane protein insertion efficiency factor YidD n=1 Tax=candidate division CSSED10-310 bacterium TaxID=2855610 RepID=A0ABV6YRU9_UNCC1